MKSLIFLSVIICTYNREKLLEKCIDSLTTQTINMETTEVFVVDNNSTDGTSSLIDRYREKIRHFKYIFEPRQGLSHARNRGCEEAQGQYLVYLDDDAIAPPHYLESIQNVIHTHHPDILGGPVYPYYLDPKPKWFKDSYEIRKYADKSEFIDSCRASGGNFIIRKELLIKLGMFDTNLGMIGNEIRLGEERAVIERYRNMTPSRERKGYYSLDCYISHYVPPSKMKIPTFLHRYYIAGKSSALIKEKTSTVFKKLLTLFPHMILDISCEIKKDRKHPDFLIVIAKNLFRLGIIVQLLKNPFSSMANPHRNQENSVI